MELPEQRKIRRPQRRFMDVVEEGLQRVCVAEKDTGLGGDEGGEDVLL